MKNERVKQLVEAYQVEQEKIHERHAAVDSDNERLQREIGTAKRELDAATDAVIENPSPENVEAERAARRKVADLTLDLSGVEHRKSRAHLTGVEKAQQLASEAIQAGREEATKYFRENLDSIVKTIEDAKYAYLSALVAYYNLHKETYDVYHGALNGTGREESPERRLHFDGNLTPFYRHGERQVYGIFPDEIERAYKRGIIYKQSVAKGREIE